MKRVKYLIFSGALSVIMQLTGSAIGKTNDNQCARFGEMCNFRASQQCCEDLVCKQGWSKESSMKLCLCNEGFRRINNQCEQENFCAFDRDCESRSNTECSEDNECVCKINYIETDLNLCRPLIGAFCEKTEECFPENSVCVNYKCQCKKDFVLQSNKRCLPIYFNWTCNPRDEICQEAQFFSCTEDRKCFCQSNYVVFNNKCVPLLNEYCSETEPCVTDNSICVNNKCECEPKYVARSNNRCLSANLYNNCKIDNDCSNIQNSKCSKFEGCICRKHYYQLNKKSCAPAIGGPCISNLDCTIQNSTCVGGYCQCKVNLTSIFNTKCLPAVHKSCRNYLGSENKTSCSALIGEQCESDENCMTNNSECFSGRCQCKKHYTPQFVDNEFDCILRISCTANTECALIKNARCSEQRVCACRDNYYAFNNLTFCAPIIGVECFSDEDCKVNNSYCFDDTCQCKPNYYLISDTRCELEQLAIRCSKDIECGDPWHTKCSEHNNCVCTPNTALFNEATCYPLLKGVCWKDDQCMIRNSICVDYHCECQLGYQPVATDLCVPRTSSLD